MAAITVVSGMPHFRLISKVSAVSSTQIDAEAVLNGAPPYTGLEIMAQAAALHVRQRLDFGRHVFLLSLRRCAMPQNDVLIGRYRVRAVLQHQSSDAFGYLVKAAGPNGEGFQGDLLIGTQAYDDHFSKAALSAHYRELWDQLNKEA